MFRLSTLGVVDLRTGQGDEGSSILGRPKRMAVLAYLALATPRGLQRRDPILGLFWPDMEEGRARRALNQSVYVLRQALGEGVVVTPDKEQIGLNPDRFACDAWEFDDALREDRPADALALYRGELLAGFHPGGPASFERWLDKARDRYARRAVEAARRVAAGCREGGNPVGAIAPLRRAAEIAQHDEIVARELMAALAEAGDRAGALREYTRLRQALGELALEASPQTVGLAEQLRSAGAVLDGGPPEPASRSDAGASAPETRSGGRPAGAGLPPGVASPGAAPPLPGSESVAVPPPRRPRAHGWWGARPRASEPALAAALVLVVLLSIGTFALIDATPPSHGPPPPAGAEAGSAPGEPTRILVRPFEVRSDHDRFSYLAEGVAAALVSRLEPVAGLRVVVPEAFVGGTVASGGSARAGTNPASELVVEGIVLEAGERLQLSASLLGDDGTLLARASAGPGEAADLFDLADTLARRLTEGLHPGPVGRLSRLAARTTSSTPALAAYLDGERALRAGHYDRALESYRAALAHDSAFALAWYRRAVASDHVPEEGRRPELARHALRHGRSLPLRDSLLLEAWSAWVSDAPREAVRQYRRVLESDPTDVEAWYRLADALYHNGWQWRLPAQEPRRAFRRVLALEPGHGAALIHLARLELQTGDREAAARYAGRFLERHPDADGALEARTLLALATRRPELFQRALEELRREDPTSPAATWSVLWYASGHERLEDLAMVLTTDRPADYRFAGHVARAAVAIGRGRPQEAERELRLAADLKPEHGLLYRGLFAAAPPGIVAVGDRTAIRAELESSPAPPTTHAASMRADLSAYTAIRSYLLHLLGDAASAEVEIAASNPAAAGEEALIPLLRAGARADVLARRGQPERALRPLEQRLDGSAPYDEGAASPLFARSRERWLRAVLLERLGRDEAALDAFASFDGARLWDLPYLPSSHLRRARIHERAGRVPEARHHYRHAMSLWADPEVASADMRCEAWAALRRLAGSNRRTPEPPDRASLRDRRAAPGPPPAPAGCRASDSEPGTGPPPRSRSSTPDPPPPGSPGSAPGTRR